MEYVEFLPALAGRRQTGRQREGGPGEGGREGGREPEGGSLREGGREGGRERGREPEGGRESNLK